MNGNDGDLSDTESIASLEADFNFEKAGTELFDLAMDADQD